MKKNVHTTSGILIKIPVAFFTAVEKTIPKSVQNHERPQIAKAIVRKNKAAAIKLPDLKLYYRLLGRQAGFSTWAITADKVRVAKGVYRASSRAGPDAKVARLLCCEEDTINLLRDSRCSHVSPRWAQRLLGQSRLAPSPSWTQRQAATPRRPPQPTRAAGNGMAASQASQASLRPPKGILKNKGSTTSSMVAPSELQPELLPNRSGDEPRKKSQRWDEVSILATYHPADKDYGLMDMDEASTLYHRMGGDDEDAMRDFEAAQALTPDALANKSAAAEGSELKIRVHGQDSSNEDFSPEKQGKRSLLSACCLLFCKCSVANAQGEERSQLQETSTAAIERKRQFEMKRKLHSNEGLNIKLGRQLSSKNLDSDEEDEEMSETAAGENMDMKESNQGSTSGDQLQTKSQSS